MSDSPNDEPVPAPPEYDQRRSPWFLFGFRVIGWFSVLVAVLSFSSGETGQGWNATFMAGLMFTQAWLLARPHVPVFPFLARYIGPVLFTGGTTVFLLVHALSGTRRPILLFLLAFWFGLFVFCVIRAGRAFARFRQR
jgi:hypothetical protein